MASSSLAGLVSEAFFAFLGTQDIPYSQHMKAVCFEPGAIIVLCHEGDKDKHNDICFFALASDVLMYL